MIERRVWQELGQGDYVYVRRDGDKLIVSACIEGRSEQMLVSLAEVKHSPNDPVIFSARRLLQRLRNAIAGR